MKGQAMFKRLLNILMNLIILAAVIMLILLGIVGVRGFMLYKTRTDYRSLSAVAGEIRSEPLFTPTEELPDFYLKAVVAIEDRDFYKHSGIKVTSMLRALIADVKAGAPVQGGSTITQQLAKNELFTQEKTVDRKAAEIFAAFALEREFTKNEILGLYVNSIYFGDGYHGIGAAAEGLFGKKPSELTRFECAELAGIPNAPAKYSVRFAPDEVEKRGEEVLKAMLSAGSITESEYDEILAEK